jgi:hypothetical protein
MTNEPILHWLVFTTNEQNTTGIFVGLSGATDVCRRIEETYPEYAQVATQLEYFDLRQPTAGPPQPVAGVPPLEPMRDTHLSAQFNHIRSSVAPAGVDDLPTIAWVTVQSLRDILGPDLATATIPWTGDVDRDGLHQVARSPVPYIAATAANGQLRGLIDQRDVLLAFAQRVLEGT